jgi:hypothetical protein
VLIAGSGQIHGADERPVVDRSGTRRGDRGFSVRLNSGGRLGSTTYDRAVVGPAYHPTPAVLSTTLVGNWTSSDVRRFEGFEFDRVARAYGCPLALRLGQTVAALAGGQNGSEGGIRQPAVEAWSISARVARATIGRVSSAR